MNLDSTLFQVHEGENRKVAENTFLGEFLLEGIDPMPKGKPNVDVTFSIDATAVLTVEAKDRHNDNTNKTHIYSFQKQ